MEKLKEFIKDFIVTEYQCNLGKYDIRINDVDFKILKDKVSSFFIESIPNSYNRADILKKAENPMYSQMYSQNLSNTRSRILFRIKELENTSLGDELKRIVRGDRVYRADMSYHEETPIEFRSFGNAYYIGETEKGLKIIYLKRFDIKNGVWEHQHDWKPSQVLEDGNLIEVEKLQAPIEPNSLKEYNKD